MLRKKFLTRAVLTTARPALVCAFGALVLFAGQECGAAGDDILQALKPVTDAMLQRQNPAADDWLMRRGNFVFGAIARSIRSPRRECRPSAARLGLEHGAGLSGGGAACARRRPLFLAPQDVVQALDGRTGDLLWEYRRQLPKIEGGYHNDLFDRARGTISLYDDKVLLATADAHLVALDGTPATSSGTPRSPITGKATHSPPDRRPPRARSLPAFPAAPIRAAAGGFLLSPSTQRPEPTVANANDCAARLAGRRQLAWIAGRQAKRRLGLDLGQLRPCPQLAVLGDGRPDPA